MSGFRHHPRAGRARRASGFSLVELLVGLAVTSILLLAVVGVFDAGSKVARVETQVADMQQSLRASHRQITRIVHMAGRGGLALSLPNVPVYQGPALAVRNAAGEAGDNGEIAVGFAGSPKAEKGSDILIARGVFSTPVFQVDTLASAFTLLDEDDNQTNDPTQATHGAVVIEGTTTTGIAQDLAPLDDAIGGGIPEALVMMSPMDERLVAVVELDPANSITTTTTPGQVTVAFKIRGGLVYPQYADLYNSGAGDPTLPVGLTSIANIGILEEYRFYVEDVPDPLPGQPTPVQHLSMARMFPGTETPYLGTLANAGIDLADNVLDLQIGLAFDSTFEDSDPDLDPDLNGDGVTDEDDMVIYESADGENDDWLFNTLNDDPLAAPWNGLTTPQPELYFVRLSLLARSARRERNHQAEELLGYEDVQALRVLEWNSFEQRMYKRRFQQTVIELRNL